MPPIDNPSSPDTYEPFLEMAAVLDVAQFSMPDGGAAEAAVVAMRKFAEWYDQRFAALNPGRDASDYFRITIDPSIDSGARKLEGQEIPIEEFLGPGYDLKNDRIQLFEHVPGGNVRGGLAYALLNPPYGLVRPRERWGRVGESKWQECEAAWMRDVLRRFCSRVLNLPDLAQTDDVRFQEWPTDWSTYFDIDEWWGAFYWTVEDRRTETITVIGAASTD